MFERFLILRGIRRRSRRVKLDISEALKKGEARSDFTEPVPKVRPLIVLEEEMVEMGTSEWVKGAVQGYHLSKTGSRILPAAR